MSVEAFSEDDVGKEVVNANGSKVGIVASVKDGVAHVDADPNITDTVKAKLGWDDTDKETHPLSQGDVTAINDDEVRVTGVPGAGKN